MSVYAHRGIVVRLLYLAIALVYAACPAPWRTGSRRRVTLCYHGVTARQRPSFERQMRWIARRPAADVRVTFDDAFANVLANALPVTAALDIPVVVFAVTGNLGSRPGWAIAPDHPDAGEVTMTADELRRAAAVRGCTIGSHGVTHRPLTEPTAEAVHAELAASRSALEQILDRRVEAFAFPHGAFDDDALAAAAAAGYRSLHTLDPTRSDPCGDATVVGRMSMSPDAWWIEFTLTARGGYAWLGRARHLVRRLRRIASAGSGRPALSEAGAGSEGHVDPAGSAVCREVKVATGRCSPPAHLLAGRMGPGMARKGRNEHLAAGLQRPRRILAVASGGGHWVQLVRLRPAFEGDRVTWVTVNPDSQSDIGTARFHAVNDATRWSRWGLVRLAVRMAFIVLRERPDVVVTTGAAPGYFAVVLGRLLGARTAWIDSMANVDQLSMCGQRAGRWADLWLTQWPALARPHGPRYEGSVV